MKYIIQEKVKHLKLQLEHYKKPTNNFTNSNTEDADKLWNASLLFANILLESDYKDPDISEE
jgi:hypothetical protein